MMFTWFGDSHEIDGVAASLLSAFPHRPQHSDGVSRFEVPISLRRYRNHSPLYFCGLRYNTSSISSRRHAIAL